MNRIAHIFCILLLLLPCVLSDGMMFIKEDTWRLHPESSQVAAIHYEQGIENLLISVSPGDTINGNHAIWIFPVPASPEKVTIDVLKGYPDFRGVDFETGYNERIILASAASVTYATFPLSLMSGIPLLVTSFVFGMSGNLESTPSGVSVHNKVEKMGVTTELVTGKNSESLETYLISKNLSIPDDARQLLDPYINKDYSFVITYISNIEEFKNESGKSGNGYFTNEKMIDTFVRFPTDTMYYPLLPTSVYTSRVVPVILYITGFVSPKTYSGIQSGTDVNYFVMDNYQVQSDGLAGFFNGKKVFDEFKYTRITISVPASGFTEDLWIDQNPPLLLRVREAVMPMVIPLYVGAYIIFSMIASLIAGKVIFKNKPLSKQFLILHGLWNCLTFIGFVIRTKKMFPTRTYGKRVPFILFFYCVFGIFLSVFTFLLSPSLLLPICGAWIAAVISPVLGLFFGLLIGSMSYSLLVTIVFLIIGFIPILILIHTWRWIDPRISPEEKEPSDEVLKQS